MNNVDSVSYPATNLPSSIDVRQKYLLINENTTTQTFNKLSYCFLNRIFRVLLSMLDYLKTYVFSYEILVGALVSFLIAMKLLTVCHDGFIGINCSTSCPSKQYGTLCSETCNCPDEICHHVYGCDLTTRKYICIF